MICIYVMYNQVAHHKIEGSDHISWYLIHVRGDRSLYTGNISNVLSL